MRSRGLRASIGVVVCVASMAVGGCSDPCANVLPPMPSPDPTPCDAGVGLSTCSSGYYCVTDAGPPGCALRKAGGARCTAAVECISEICQSDATCALPRGCLE